MKSVENQEREIREIMPHTTKDRKHETKVFLGIHELEVERVKYMLKSYLRTRLFKIQKFMFFIIECDQGHLLSDDEF